MKRSLKTDEECFPLLEECYKHKDVWSEIVKKLTVVDELIMTCVSNTTKSYFSESFNSPRFHFLKASWKCGYTGFNHLCSKSKNCAGDIVYKGITNTCVLQQKKVNEIEVWALDEKQRILTINISLRKSMCPNFRSGDTGLIKFFQLSVPIGHPEKEVVISYLCNYLPVFNEANGMKRGLLTKEKYLSEYEIQSLTKDLECVVYSDK